MNWGTAFLTITLTSIFLPVAMWGRKFAAVCKCKSGSFAFAIVSCIVPTFFYNTFATLVLVGVNVSFSAPFYMHAVLGDWPKMFAISYIAALIVEPFAIKIAMSEYPPQHHK